MVRRARRISADRGAGGRDARGGRRRCAPAWALVTARRSVGGGLRQLQQGASREHDPLPRVALAALPFDLDVVVTAEELDDRPHGVEGRIAKLNQIADLKTELSGSHRNTVHARRRARYWTLVPAPVVTATRTVGPGGSTVAHRSLGRADKPGSRETLKRTFLPKADQVKYGELVADLKRHYDNTESRNVAEVNKRLAHLDPLFAGARAAKIDAAMVARYVERRRSASLARTGASSTSR